MIKLEEVEKDAAGKVVKLKCSLPPALASGSMLSELAIFFRCAREEVTILPRVTSCRSESRRSSIGSMLGSLWPHLLRASRALLPETLAPNALNPKP